MTPTRDERIEEIRWRTYGPKNTPINKHRCAYVVCRTFVNSYQCYDEPGHGLGGLYCKQHAKNNPEVE